MRLVDAQVVLNDQVAPGIHLLRLHAPEIARDALPGQFVHLRCAASADPILRRPISLHGIGKPGGPGDHRGKVIGVTPGVVDGPSAGSVGRPRHGEIDLLFARVGRGTSLLTALPCGEQVSVLGPLGRGFRVSPRARNLLLVSGGLGMAPLSALAADAVRMDLAVTMLCGFRSGEASLPPWLLPPEVEYVVCTDDGSLGRKGMVTDFVAELTDWADEVFACGPRPMLSALARSPLSGRLAVQVSLEERMACGVGACMGCSVRTKKGLKQVCRDGPVFDMGDILWE